MFMAYKIIKDIIFVPDFIILRWLLIIYKENSKFDWFIPYIIITHLIYICIEINCDITVPVAWYLEALFLSQINFYPSREK